MITSGTNSANRLHHPYDRVVTTLRSTFFPSLILGAFTVVGATRTEKFSWKVGLGMMGFGIIIGRLCPSMIRQYLNSHTTPLDRESNSQKTHEHNQGPIEDSQPDETQLWESKSPFEQLLFYAYLSRAEQKKFSHKSIDIASAIKDFDEDELAKLHPIEFIRIFVSAVRFDKSEETTGFFQQLLAVLFKNYDAPEGVDLITNLTQTFLPAYAFINGSELELAISHEFSQHVGKQMICHTLILNDFKKFNDALVSDLPGMLNNFQMFSLLKGVSTGLEEIKQASECHDFVEKASNSVQVCKKAFFEKTVEKHKSYCTNINENFEAFVTDVETLLLLYRSALIEESDLGFLAISINHALEALFGDDTVGIGDKLYTIMRLIFYCENEQVKNSFTQSLFNREIQPKHLPEIWSLIDNNELRETLEYFKAKESLLNYITKNKVSISQTNPWGEETPEEIAQLLS